MTTKETTKGSSPPAGGGQGVLSLLVAADENGVIGKDNKLPWHLPNDLKYFKNLTWGMPVVMGRKTFESIGKPLPGRQNIVITRNRDWEHNGVRVIHTMEKAIEAAQESDAKELFIIGGAQIFETTFQQAARIYLTRIHHSFDGDVYFPEIGQQDWHLVKQHTHQPDEKNPYPHTFQVWERK